MSWWPFLANQWAWLFLLLVPLVIFYFLKLKRPRLEIPSLALWRSVLNDQRGQFSLSEIQTQSFCCSCRSCCWCAWCWRRCSRLFPAGPTGPNYLPILIDTSASMAAVDETRRSRGSTRPSRKSAS